MNYLYIGNDMTLSFEGGNKLTNQDGDGITGATVEVTLYESDATTEVEGYDWPLSFTEDGNGEYSAVLPDTIDIALGSVYVMNITAESGSANARWVYDVKATYRRNR